MQAVKLLADNLHQHQMWGNKPPRRKRGSQRRLTDISFFAGIGVEPSPLFEWSVFGFFWGVPKETRHRSAETLLIPVIYATIKACISRTYPVRLPAGAPRRRPQCRNSSLTFQFLSTKKQPRDLTTSGRHVIHLISSNLLIQQPLHLQLLLQHLQLLRLLYLRQLLRPQQFPLRVLR